MLSIERAHVAGISMGGIIAMEDVGHMFWWEQPERSAALVREHALTPA